MNKLFHFQTFCFTLLMCSITSSSQSYRLSNRLNATFCLDCALPRSIKICNFEFYRHSNNSCWDIRFPSITNLQFCCTCHNKDTFLPQRDQNFDNLCYRILERFHHSTKHVNARKVQKSFQSVPSMNNRRITKPSSHIHRKLLMQKNGNESSYSSFYSTIQKNQQGHYEWGESFQNVVLQCLILLVMVFTFFAIIIAMIWLCSLYVLKRIKRQKNAFNDNVCLDVTEF